MPYYPYFRGKQFELKAIQEKAQLIADAGFTPIIEPVKESLSALERAFEALSGVGAKAIVVINPAHGKLRDDSSPILDLLHSKYLVGGFLPGILLRDSLSSNTLTTLLDNVGTLDLAFIHAGSYDASAVAAEIKARNLKAIDFFDQKTAGPLNLRRFEPNPRILLKDGLTQTKNSLYPKMEQFSDLHVTYRERGFDGYGDFSIVGDNYSETGGPAWAVAIHLTFVDPNNQNEMYVYHFKSDSNDSPADPANKFSEALTKLIAEVNSPRTKVLQSSAVSEFRDLHRRKHFPGLGYVKKLSMIHHLETLAAFEASNP